MSAHLLLLAFAGTKYLGPEKTTEAFKRLASARRLLRLDGRARSREQVKRRIERGLRWLPLPVECLDQAIVTWYLMNLKGHPATLRIGMRLSPMFGHAWVESNGEIFGGVPGIEDMAIVSEIEPF